MAKKDRILNEFYKHEAITNNPQIIKETLPKKVEDAKNSDNLLIAALGIIVEQIDKGTSSAEGIDALIMKKINALGTKS